MNKQHLLSFSEGVQHYLTCSMASHFLDYTHRSGGIEEIKVVQ